ncbi:hypothetical protein J6590_086690 [Homalodisca vitripennis]|nr:hypothetical protein J6590_086690 [Homalodisca vitripennis]
MGFYIRCGGGRSRGGGSLHSVTHPVFSRSNGLERRASRLCPFRVHFNIPRNDPVPHRNVIASWVRALEETGSTQRPKGMGRPKTARTPENVAVVRAAVE